MRLIDVDEMIDNMKKSVAFEDDELTRKLDETVVQYVEHLINDYIRIAEQDCGYAEDIVRCNDCRFFKGDGLECHWGMFAYEDDYCSNGKRREDATKGHEG